MAAPASLFPTLGGPFGEADLEAEQLGSERIRCTYPPESGWEQDLDAAVSAELRDTAPGRLVPAEPERESSIRELLDASDPFVQRDTAPTPGSIEDALVHAAESQPRSEPASHRRVRLRRSRA